MKPGEKWKIIFLDVDGVLCIPPAYNGFNKVCMDNLMLLIEKTKAKVVISSSWRTGKLEDTIKLFPKRLQPYIIGETIRGYKETVEGSSLPICRGNEIKHWLDRHVVYPWHAYPELDELYKERNTDGSFKNMNSNELNVDYTYIILDDANDMLYTQKDNFILIKHKFGLIKENIFEAITKLNKI